MPKEDFSVLRMHGSHVRPAHRHDSEMNMSDIETARECLSAARRAMDAIDHYSCTIFCQERINGKPRKPEQILFRYQRPGSVYLRWLPGPFEGLQCSYVPERDGKGKFQARETGLRGMVGTVTWSDDSPIIDKMYPHYFRTHETSLVHMIELASDIQTRAEAKGLIKVDTIDEVVDTHTHDKATRVVTTLSSSKNDGLLWSKTELFFDRESALPIHFKLYDFDGALSGEYAFVGLDTKVPSSPKDFVIHKL